MPIPPATDPADAPIAQLLVTSEAIRRYARLTLDENPIHLDADFARTTPMGGIIAHGTMSAALIWQALRLNAPTSTRNHPDDFAGARLSIRFRRPVRIDDIVRGEAVSGDEPDRYAVRVVRQDGECVIEGSLALPHRPGRADRPL